MPTVDQLLRSRARARGSVPLWILEKDYALAYLLAGMAQIPALSNALVLKGGTALRKFYFADYRFSEDLDFSLLKPLPEADAAIQAGVAAAGRLLLEQGPFDIWVERLELREPHPGGQDAFTVRLRFPSHREALCRLKVEITHDEAVLVPPPLRALAHPYPGPLKADWHCYALEEIVAEKLRALLQSRARLHDRGWGASRVCRDYYDLWYLLTHSALGLAQLPRLLASKCALRGVTFTGCGDFLAPELRAVAEAEWARQLLPFVPGGPTAETVLVELAEQLLALPLEGPVPAS